MGEISARQSSGEREVILKGGSFYPDQQRWGDRQDTVARVVYVAEQTERFLGHEDPQSWFGFASPDSVEGLRELRDLPTKFYKYPKE